MTGRKWAADYPVSTEGQGRSGLSPDVQRRAVRAYLAGKGWPAVQEFKKVESSKRADRRELAKMVAACRLHGGTLVGAKLDRPARNTRFLLSVAEGTGEEDVVFCDLPLYAAGHGREVHGHGEGRGRRVGGRADFGPDPGGPDGCQGPRRDSGRPKGGRQIPFPGGADKGKAASATLGAAKARQTVGDLSVIIADPRASGAASLRVRAADLNRPQRLDTAGGVVCGYGLWGAGEDAGSVARLR